MPCGITVSRKDDMLRLVFDCRPPNQLLRQPPSTSSATPGAFATLDLSDEWLGLNLGDDKPFVGGAIDLVGSFYQLGYSGLSEFFSLDAEFSAAEVGVRGVRSHGGSVYPLADGNGVYGCLSVLPMGWSWPPWCCHETLADIT